MSHKYWEYSSAVVNSRILLFRKMYIDAVILGVSDLWDTYITALKRPWLRMVMAIWRLYERVVH